MTRSRTSGVAGTTRISGWMVAGLLSMTATLAHADRITVFTDDFERPALGTQWSGARLDNADALTRFAGRMTTDPVDLTLPPPPENQSKAGRITYYMRFDLITLGGWTGKTPDGKDTRFAVKVGDKVRFSHSLASMIGHGSYRNPTIGPKALAGDSSGSGSEDCIYRGVQLAFQLKADEDLNVQFRALGLEHNADMRALSAALSGGEAVGGMSSPAWGIDNVEIWFLDDNDGAGSAWREAESPLVTSSTGVIGSGGGDMMASGGGTAPRPPISTYQVPEPKDLLPGGGGGGGGGTTVKDPTVVPPFTPPGEETIKPPQRPEPDPTDPHDPEDPLIPHDPHVNPPVPSPGVLTVMGAGLASLCRRRRMN